MSAQPPWRRRVGLALLAAALLAGLVFVAWRAGPLAATRVTVARAAAGRFDPALFGIGSVEAQRAYLIGPTAAGRVRRVAVDVGDHVRAGQLLAEIDSVDLDQRVAALDAAIARAASLATAAQAQRIDARAKWVLAAANARRTIDLGQQNFISPGAVDARLQEQASAEAAQNAAAANLAAAQQDLNRLAAERAGLREQRDSLRLLAPADAVVVGRDAEAGSTVVAGQAVLRLIAPQSLWVRLRLDQGRSAGLAAGLAARIVLRSDPGRPVPGKVLRVEPLSDSVTEERIALVTFDTLPAGVSVGELAEVTLALPRTAPTLLVPAASLRHQREQTGVWRVDGSRLRFVPVRTGLASLDGQVQVLEGLRAGDTVVVHSEKALAADSRFRTVAALVAEPR